MAVDPSPDPVTHTPGSVYIADGYGNHRIVVYTTADGGKTYTYNRQWGTTCVINGVAATARRVPPGRSEPLVAATRIVSCSAMTGTSMPAIAPTAEFWCSIAGCGTARLRTIPEPLCPPKRIINIGLNAGQTPPSECPGHWEQCVHKTPRRKTPPPFWAPSRRDRATSISGLISTISRPRARPARTSSSMSI